MLYSSLALAHVSVGCIALLTYWTAALAKKGGQLHLRAGRIYLLAMLGIIVTGLPLTIFRALKGEVIFPVFLGYLLIITGTACWTAWTAIKAKRNRAAFADRRFRAIAWLNVLAGAGVLWLGVSINNGIILVAFSFVGIVGGISSLLFARSLKADPRWWLRQHTGAMIGNGIATHIAFLSIGLPRLSPTGNSDLIQNVAWLAPLVAASIAYVWIKMKYLRAASPLHERVG